MNVFRNIKPNIIDKKNFLNMPLSYLEFMICKDSKNSNSKLGKKLLL